MQQISIYNFCGCLNLSLTANLEGVLSHLFITAGSLCITVYLQLIQLILKHWGISHYNKDINPYSHCPVTTWFMVYSLYLFFLHTFSKIILRDKTSKFKFFFQINQQIYNKKCHKESKQRVMAFNTKVKADAWMLETFSRRPRFSKWQLLKAVDFPRCCADSWSEIRIHFLSSL